jgi:hypothetical protein
VPAAPQSRTRIPLPLVPDRVALEDAHHALLAGLASGAALPGFAPDHLAETRAIFAAKSRAALRSR